MKKEKGSRRISVRVLLILLAGAPMAIVTIVLAWFSAHEMSQAIGQEVLGGLKSTATSVSSILQEADPGTLAYEDGILKVGDHDLTAETVMFDNIAAQNEMEISVFVGNTRRYTTITDQTGNRVVGEPCSDAVRSAVLMGGQTYEVEDADIGGSNYYGVYLPYTDSATNEIVGMVFVGKSRDAVSQFVAQETAQMCILAVILLVVFGISDTYLIKTRIMQPIRELSGIAQSIAQGDINVNAEKKSNDEFGDLMDDFNAMVTNIKNQAAVAERFADGDLTVKYAPVGEKDVMGQALQKMIHDNNKNLSTIKDASARMSSGANEVASASNSLAQGTTQQASAIEEITASIEEIANGARVNADHANTANELVKTTREGAELGNTQMKNMISAMKDINESSENISKIMKVIDDIAFQTNILALNASVEAARAGVHGKGFAVVADEVRNLASKSAEAAKDSAEMIEDSIRKVEVGSKLAEETGRALEEIQNSVENIANLVANIATASENQATSVGQVNAGITQIADVVQTNSATSQQCAAASAELSNLSDQLQHSVGKYKLQATKSGSRNYESNFDKDEDYGNVDNESLISLGDDFGKY